MREVKEKFRNVTFSVSESLIEEIDSFCEERGGLKRKEWLFNLISSNDTFKTRSKKMTTQLGKLQKDFYGVKSDYTELIKNNEILLEKLNDVQTAHSELFTSTLKYRTFFKRLKNLFSKF